MGAGKFVNTVFLFLLSLYFVCSIYYEWEVTNIYSLQSTMQKALYELPTIVETNSSNNEVSLSK